jgi:asparagine synthase (glutamine-hydrolysing)
MCGIAGILSQHPLSAPKISDQVNRMIQAVRHRGPDGHGLWQNHRGTIGLGHARLSIIDLSSEGSQPMLSPCGRLAITFNGEIYNYIELRKDLAAEGGNFRGHSDTEVFLMAMEVWGIEEALCRASGMFALAVWDETENALYLARDRVGKKPLYYYKGKDIFHFASEIKGLVVSPEIPRKISFQALGDYLSLGFVHGPDTIYEDIIELTPGTLLRIDGASLREDSKRFWEFPAEISINAKQFEIQEETERLLKDSIRLRLRSDVPVGVFLSGGIDSGLITAMAAESVPSTLKTFTVSFGTSAFDESDLARKVAERYQTEHHEIRLDPDLDSLLPKIACAYDEPFADPSALPTYAISSEAAKYVKVVLNGEGSDEQFGGYRRHFAIKSLERLTPFLPFLPKKALSRILNWLPYPKGIRTPYSFMHRFIRAAFVDPHVRYLLWGTDTFDEEEKESLFGAHGNPPLKATHQVLSERWTAFANSTPTAQFMALDFVVGMADCLLPKIDIACMAHGLEGRSPFLHHPLVEWVAQVEKSDLLAGRNTKPVLRSIAQKYLPAEVVNAPKRGFEIPLVSWMKEDLRDMVYGICTRERSLLFDLFDRSIIMDLLDRRIVLDDERWAKRVWVLFMLANWGYHVHEKRIVRT